MRGIFNLDGPFFTAMSKVADIVILNLLFILCSIPVITMGASMTALSYVMLKIKEGEEGYVTRSFFRSFKENFLQATLVWLILLVVAAALFMDWRIIPLMNASQMKPMRIIVVAGVIIWLMIVIYIFPLIARYRNKTTVMFKNAVLLALANAPKTILMMVILGASAALTIWNTSTFIWGILVWLLAGFALLAYINSIFLIRIFHRLEPEKEAEEDEWTLDDVVEGQFKTQNESLSELQNAVPDAAKEELRSAAEDDGLR